MEEEKKSIQKNDASELTTILKGHEAMRVKQVYKDQKNASGKIEKYQK